MTFQESSIVKPVNDRPSSINPCKAQFRTIQDQRVNGTEKLVILDDIAILTQVFDNSEKTWSVKCVTEETETWSVSSTPTYPDPGAKG